MLIINADDWGRSLAETDAAFRCYKAGRITSVSVMVFVADSERAAELAQENGLNVGVHLNLTEGFAANRIPATLETYHNKIPGILTRNRYSHDHYNPYLQRWISHSCQ